MKQSRCMWMRGSLLLMSAALSGCSLLGDLVGYPDAAGREIPTRSVAASYPLLERAREAYAAGHYGNAIELLEQELARRPASINALNGLGASYDKLGRFDVSRRYYFRALTLAPESALTLSNLGYSYLLQGQYGYAVAYLGDALEHDPGNVHAASNLALVRSMLLAGEPAAQALANSEVAPEDISLRVSNGNGIRNAARAVSHWLEARQIPVSSLGDASHYSFPRSVLLYRPGLDRAAERLARRLEWGRVLLQESMLAPGTDMELVLGRDFAAWTNELVAQVQPVDTPVGTVEAGIEIANGNGITGSAARLRDLLATRGTPVLRLTNADSFTYPRSVLYYRSGRLQAAEDLRTLIGAADIALSESADLDAGIDLRLVLGQDLVYPDDTGLPLLLANSF